jgi:ABC-type transport system involved in multi-copper enzyme maturation permease subunit
MTWLTYRQFRTQLIAAATLLAVLVTGLVALGLWMRHSYDTGLAVCDTSQTCNVAERAFRLRFQTPVVLLSGLLLAVPAVIGSFWGAPLVTRELETGTHRLVWTQSITRTRWLAVKLAVVGAVTLAVTAASSAALTWAAGPVDDVQGSRFGALTFGSRNLAPLGYALFALALGTVIGLIVRRTLPAMALTIGVFAVLQVAVPFALRPHLMPPVERSIPVNEVSLSEVSGLGFIGGSPPEPGEAWDPSTAVVVSGYQVPGAWMLTSEVDILQSNGQRVSPAEARPCFQQSAGPAGTGDCLEQQDLHFDVAYQPAARYWPFQGIETAGFTVLAALLTGFAFWRIPRGIAAA